LDEDGTTLVPCAEDEIDGGSSNVGGGSTGNTGDINDIPDGGSTPGTGGGIPPYGGGDTSGGGGSGSNLCLTLVSAIDEDGNVTSTYWGYTLCDGDQKKSVDLKKDECLYCPEVVDGGVGVNTDVDRLIVEQSFIDEECLYNAYKRMVKTSSSFNTILQSFDEDFSVADLIFTVDDNFKSTKQPKYHGAFAITEPPLSNNKVKIVFNTDPSLDSDITKQPDVFKAVSLIHEAIHANMYRKMLDVVRAADISGNNLDWTNWTSEQFYNDFLDSLENKYAGIFYYFTKYKYGVPTDQEPNDYQHQQLAQYYRDVIKQVLTDFDTSLTDEEKEALSWIGLNKADIVAWQNLTPNERTAINNIQTQIKNTFPNGCD